MPLSPDDNARLYSDAFTRAAKTMLGDASFAYADLKANLEVAQAQSGVLQDELKAVTVDRDRLKALWEGSTEGKDAALQASADEAASRSA